MEPRNTVDLTTAIDTLVLFPTPAADKTVARKSDKYYGYLGNLISLVFSLGTAVTAAAALATIFSGPLFFVLVAVIPLGTFYANYRMTRHDVTNVVRGGVRGLFKKDAEKMATNGEAGKQSSYISPRKSILLGLGILCACMFGGAMAALTFNSTIIIAATFPILAAVSVALPPLGIVLGIVTFMCLSALMMKAFSELAKTENLFRKIKKGFTNLFYYDPIRDANKSILRLVCERVLVGVTAIGLAMAVVALIAWGKVETLTSCANSFNEILMKMPHASAFAAKIASIAIVRVGAFIAQIPFVLKTSFTPIVQWFSSLSLKLPPSQKPPATRLEKVQTGALVVSSTLNSAGMAAIAIFGKALNALTILGGIGAFFDGFTTNVVNGVRSGQQKTSRAQAPVSVKSHTAQICAILQGNDQKAKKNPPPIKTTSFPKIASKTRLFNNGNDLLTTERRGSPDSPRTPVRSRSASP